MKLLELFINLHNLFNFGSIWIEVKTHVLLNLHDLRYENDAQ